MAEKITINPITRLEGHGKIEIFLDDRGDVAETYWQVAELRGFERFCLGRPAEEMTRIAPNICGICPSAHHMAATKALDRLFGVEPPPAARLVRELEYNAFFVEDHFLHFFFLAGPDLLLGPDTPPEGRNIIGIANTFGTDLVQRVMDIRRKNRDIIRYLFGKAPHPEGGLPGGVPKGICEADRPWLREIAAETVAFASFALQLYRDKVLGNPANRQLLESDAYRVETCSMALVDDRERMSFYDGTVKIVDSAGAEVARFAPAAYREHIGEWVEPWSSVKLAFLRQRGWQGLVEGPGSPLYRVAPLARLNVASAMNTPLAQQAFEELHAYFGPGPVHHSMATHWARLICALQAAERVKELVEEPLLTSHEIRNLDFRITGRGVGCVEAPRGTLFHDYECDEKGLLTRVNLLVATQQNAGPISIAVKKAAKQFIRGGEVREGLLNRVEMAFRAFDPCLSCATHVLDDRPALSVIIRDAQGRIVQELPESG
jgi:F420-non-reducing hydrogenase large subunit